MRTPKKWDELTVGRKCWVRLPHSMALLDPEYQSSVILKEGVVQSSRGGESVIELRTGGSISVTNLHGVEIDEKEAGR